MFHSYLFPISYAFMLFPVAALFFTLPFLIVQYRRHGYINKIRALVLYMLLLYLMNVYFLVILPLPASIHNLAPAGGAFQGIPFQFIQDISSALRASSPDGPITVSALLHERAFLQVSFNVLMTVPFGMFLNYYFRTRWVVCLLLSFGLSLFFEVTQITAIYGIYDHPYRVFDVDDLMANTLGGATGYWIASWVSKLLPKIDKLDANTDLAAKRVTYLRRGIALMMDGILCLSGYTVLRLVNVPGAYWIVSGIYFMLIPYMTGGVTFGKWLVRIKIQQIDGSRITLWGLIKRYGLLYWVVFGLNALMLETSVLQDLGSPWYTLSLWLLFLIHLSFFIHSIIRILFKKSGLLYEQLSRTTQVILWPEDIAPEEQRYTSVITEV